MTTALIGQPVSRVDGRQKVTGSATYAAEFAVPNVAHAAVVRSTVANGRIQSINTAEAERAGGVLAVLTHRNAPRLAYRPHKGLPDAAVGERLHVLQDDRVNHQGQPIALVVAETLDDRIELEGQLSGWVDRLLGEMQQQDIAVERASTRADLQRLLDANSAA
jgi:xanthine dehydrogenase YagR molybdenum-binding subunit